MSLFENKGSQKLKGMELRNGKGKKILEQHIQILWEENMLFNFYTNYVFFFFFFCSFFFAGKKSVFMPYYSRNSHLVVLLLCIHSYEREMMVGIGIDVETNTMLSTISVVSMCCLMPPMNLNGILGEGDHIHNNTQKAHEGYLIKELLDKKWNVHVNLMESWKVKGLQRQADGTDELPCCNVTAEHIGNQANKKGRTLEIEKRQHKSLSMHISSWRS